ncbi:S-adenosyl-L-methionine-dependent methyltransferase [Chytriomyces cf. hyalinus JEL632]|nr:S-adenosyl-L-methionine-dependent methyltransferase [Chytriomyces cf. hyalinus JEL632]
MNTGAIVVPKSKAQAVIAALRKLKWLKSDTNVTGLSSEPDAIAVHVTSDAAALIPYLMSSSVASESHDATTTAPNGHNNKRTRRHPSMVTFDQDALKTLQTCLNNGNAVFRAGLRVRSRECVRISNKTDDTTYKHIPTVPISSKDARFEFVELFAGIGGFRVALDTLGGRAVFASEISEAARQTYVANFGNEVFSSTLTQNPVPVLVGDITEIETEDIPNHDILTAGFPCQSFCKVGDRTALDDDRGELFFEVVRILKGKKPKAFVLENVANLVTMEAGAVFETITHHLKQAGYHVHHKIIDASHYVPQTRKRVYIIGFLDASHASKFQFPPTPTTTTTKHRLHTILSPDPPPESLILNPHQLEKLQSSYSYKKNPAWRIANCNQFARTLMSSYRSGFAMYSEFVPVPTPPVLEDLNAGENDFDVADLDASPTSKRPKLGDASTSSPTINEDLSLPPQPQLYERLRFYSPRECARIMGFPESYILDHCKTPGTLYHQIGNAVCPPVIAAIATNVLIAIGK